MSGMENTITDNTNISLTYPYAAKDSNGNKYIVLGPSAMTPCNVLRIDNSSIVPLQYTSTQLNNLVLIPAGVTITMVIDPQYSAPAST